MKATEANLLRFLKKSPQFAIPIYQRNYAWTALQCRQLWSDMLRAGRNAKISAHFVGSIVYIESGLFAVVQQEALLVIDGQQRLTTASLLIAALALHFETHQLGEILEAFSTKKLRNYYLLNPDEEGERHYKLLLSETDKATLLAIVKNQPLPAVASSRIQENFALFQSLIAQHEHELAAVCQGLAKLVIVDVALERTQDNPQLIFESMNSTGLALSQADLIRNYVLMGLPARQQTELYKTHWRPMEQAFGQDGYSVHFDAFMRHYLTVQSDKGDIPNLRDVYTTFKAHAQNLQSQAGTVSTLVADIHAFAGYYCAIALGIETDKELKKAFADLRELKVDVAYPFLLAVYHDYQSGLLPTGDFLTIVRWVESYVFRRAICAIPTNSQNKTFAVLSRAIDKNRYLDSVQAAFLLLPSYRRFPNEEEFERDIQLRDLYNFRSRSYWLRRLENQGRKERVIVEDYTIEHILPQNEKLSTAWQTELGPHWQTVQQTWLHTLGNLTLTGYNSQYSDRSFGDKKSALQDANGNLIGLAYSPLWLNQGFAEVMVFNEEAIKLRAARLAKRALQTWPGPVLSAAVLDTFRPAANPSPQNYYSLQSYPALAAGPVLHLFESFRQAILALDPCVSEEFLKLYIAYKAETNFVDVVPQTKGLRLTLNCAFAEIEDPKNLCRDMTDVGQWGNGDVRLDIATPQDLPYALGLVRQVFEKQQGSAN